MTREEYLKQLKNNILALTEDEQAEALQYYSDYFEDADNDEKVMSELGSPEELAAVIKEKCANALVNTKASVKEDKNNSDKRNYSDEDDILYYEYKKSEVKSLSLNLGAADVVVISGNKYAVETRGIQKDAFNCFLDKDGRLLISNSRRININFWSHDRKLSVVPRILITVPENASLDLLKVAVGAGNLRTKDVTINFEKANIDVGAGNLVLRSAKGGSANIRCGMGNLEYYGLLTGKVNIDCGMGNTKIFIEDDADKYSYDAKIGLGSFKFNNEKKSGVSQVLNNERKENHVSINCGMGNVSVKFEK